MVDVCLTTWDAQTFFPSSNFLPDPYPGNPCNTSQRGQNLGPVLVSHFKHRWPQTAPCVPGSDTCSCFSCVRAVNSMVLVEGIHF